MKKSAKIIFIIVTIIFIVLNVYSSGFNGFTLYEQQKYTYLADTINSGVVGSVVGSRDLGVFHVYGLQAKFWIDKTFSAPTSTDDNGFPGDMTAEEFEAMKPIQKAHYLNDVTVTTEDMALVYRSKVNLGGIFFSLLDRFLSLFKLSQIFKLGLFHALSAIFATLLFVFIGYWAYKEFGLLSALFVYASVFFSIHLIPYGSGLSNSVFVYFLPFTLSLFVLERQQTKNKIWASGVIFTSMMFAIALKSMMGYEALPTIMVSATIPHFYYAYAYQWSFKTFAMRFMYISMAAITGFVLVLAIHFVQLSLYLNSFALAKQEILYSVNRRFWGDPSLLATVYKPGLSATVKQVIIKYFAQLSHQYIGSVSLITVLSLFLICTIYILLKIVISKKTRRNTQTTKLKALTLSTGIGFLGALSTLIVLKGHSYWHINLTSLVFHLPFSILLFALLGAVVKDIVQLKSNINQ